MLQSVMTLYYRSGNASEVNFTFRPNIESTRTGGVHVSPGASFAEMPSMREDDEQVRYVQ